MSSELLKGNHLERLQRGWNTHESNKEFLQRSRGSESGEDGPGSGSFHSGPVSSSRSVNHGVDSVGSRGIPISLKQARSESFEEALENTTMGELRMHAGSVAQGASSLPNFRVEEAWEGPLRTPPLSTGDIEEFPPTRDVYGYLQNLESLPQGTNFTEGDMEIAKEMVTNYFEELQELDHTLEKHRMEYKMMDDQRRELEARLQEAIEERDKAEKIGTNETRELVEQMRNKKEELETNELRAEVEALQRQISGLAADRESNRTPHGRKSGSPQDNDKSSIFESGSASDSDDSEGIVEKDTARRKSRLDHAPKRQYNFMEIEFDSLVLGQRIGIGTFGEVYKATWNNTDVAVKKLLVQDMKPEHLEDFRAEVEILSNLRHPNVVLFMGACTKHPNFSIVTEFCPRGSLFHVLHYSNAKIDHKRRLKIALDVALGINYLHNLKPMLVHRDIKSPNLLVDKNWNVKVGDFGLSRIKRHMYLSTNSCAGTPNWMAPEVLRGDNYNEKADIYSFGVVLWELFVRQVPFGGLNPMQVASIVGHQNRRMLIPSTCDTDYAELIRRCWHSDPTKRPSLDEVIGTLKKHLDVLERASASAK